MTNPEIENYINHQIEPPGHYLPGQATATKLPALKDSGQRENFDTGSRRDTREGKGRYDLLPTRALRRLARHFEAGSKKYGDRNWEKGQPLSRFLDSGIRHALNYLEGQRDEDHLIAAIWNLFCAADTEERIKAGQLPADLADVPGSETFRHIGLLNPKLAAALRETPCDCNILQTCSVCAPQIVIPQTASPLNEGNV